MRKTMIAIALGLTALAAAACGNSGTDGSPGLETTAPLESMPLESVGTESMDPLASPSDMLESPASS
jgi:hypothetical protein